MMVVCATVCVTRIIAGIWQITVDSSVPVNLAAFRPAVVNWLREYLLCVFPGGLRFTLHARVDRRFEAIVTRRYTLTRGCLMARPAVKPSRLLPLLGLLLICSLRHGVAAQRLRDTPVQPAAAEEWDDVSELPLHRVNLLENEDVALKAGTIMPSMTTPIKPWATPRVPSQCINTPCLRYLQSIQDIF